MKHCLIEPPNPVPRFKKFQVEWTVDSVTYNYSTRKPGDIEEFSPTHFRVTCRPDASSGEDDFQFVIRFKKGTWTVRSDDFDEPEDYPYEYSENGSESIWTEEGDDERMVIRGM